VQSLTTRNGGFIFAEQVNLMPKDPNSSGLASATVTIHVPPTSLASVLAQISALGIELDRNQHVEDVTAQVVDVDARATAAQNSLKRLNELFAHAGSVAELTSLEQQIAQREAERDSLLSQQKTLAAQVAAATITVNLVGTPAVAAAVPQPKKAHVFGFLKGLRGGWHALTKTASGLATAFGALLPFLVILAVLGVGALAVRRRVVQARRGHEPPAQPDPIV
jgi:VIT1/CCC1 family predicted Fe2+/Mn2+ transporter